MKTDVAAGAAEIPGLVVRPYGGERDLREIVRIHNAEWEADGVPARVGVDELRATFAHVSDGFDPSRDVHIAELDGRPVATTQVEWVDATDGVREFRVGGRVDPAFRRRGIGAALLARNEQHARALADAQEPARPRVLGMIATDENAGAAVLAERFGYTAVRWFFQMERPIDGDLPDVPPMPAGLQVRAVGPDAARRIWDVDHEAFQDHWGGHDPSESNFRRWLDSPEFEPSLFLIAFDGDEIAGGILNAIYPDENEALGLRRGWLDSVFTRRPWRRRGLARALIVRSLHLLRERGMTGAALGVDAENPSGALGLYESAGFAVTERMTAWRKPMDGPA